MVSISLRIYIDKQEGPLERVVGILHHMAIQWSGNADCSRGTLNMTPDLPRFHMERFLLLHALHPNIIYIYIYIERERERERNMLVAFLNDQTCH